MNLNLKQYIRQKKYYFLLKWYYLTRYNEWNQLKSDKSSICGNGGVFVIPCDPWSLTGSRGDEAMLYVIQEQFPEKSIHIVTATEEADKSALAHGWIPEHCWIEKGLLNKIFNKAKEIRPTICIVLGADVMDGYYSHDFSITLFAIADIFKYHGVPTSLLGFSFNSQPHKKVLKALNRMENDFTFHLRDNASLMRFEKVTGKKGKLVSDVAFLLAPDKETPQYKNIDLWKKNEGRPLLLVNLHPMLVKHASQDQINQMIETLSKVINKIIESTNWNILLIPHDNRAMVSDNICLAPIYQDLEKWKNRIIFISDVLDAKKLKGIVSLADAMVTSRMHLGIAGLSQGIPTMGFTYQDKFQGMIQHFGLDREFILPLPNCENETIIETNIKRLLDNKDMIARQLIDKLPSVLALAQKNFVSLKKS